MTKQQSHSGDYGAPQKGQEYERPEYDHVWLGDLSGFTLAAVVDQKDLEPHVLVEHRCGWSVLLDDMAYVANLVGPEGPIAAHRREGCS